MQIPNGASPGVEFPVGTRLGLLPRALMSALPGADTRCVCFRATGLALVPTLLELGVGLLPERARECASADLRVVASGSVRVTEQSQNLFGFLECVYTHALAQPLVEPAYKPGLIG